MRIRFNIAQYIANVFISIFMTNIWIKSTKLNRSTFIGTEIFEDLILKWTILIRKSPQRPLRRVCKLADVLTSRVASWSTHKFDEKLKNILKKKIQTAVHNIALSPSETSSYYKNVLTENEVNKHGRLHLTFFLHGTAIQWLWGISLELIM